MGQYFLIVNMDKKECVSPWKVGTGAKFLEWLYKRPVRVFAWLLRKSDGDGGGDIPHAERGQYETLGRWAGDRIALIGDYDSSGLYETAHEHYTDISDVLRRELGDAIRKDGRLEKEL